MTSFLSTCPCPVCPTTGWCIPAALLVAAGLLLFFLIQDGQCP